MARKKEQSPIVSKGLVRVLLSVSSHPSVGVLECVVPSYSSIYETSLKVDNEASF